MKAAEFVHKQCSFTLKREARSADLADNPGWQSEEPGALGDLLGETSSCCQHIAALIFAEPSGVRRKLPLVGIEFDAVATGQRHLCDRNNQATVAAVVHGGNFAFPDQGSHEITGLDLVVEVDGRGRALRLVGDDQLIKRLAKVAFLAADQEQQVARRFHGDASGL